MIKDFDILLQYIRFHKYYYLILHIIIYFLIFPYCLYTASIEIYDKEIVLFATLQKYLILTLLLYNLLFIKNYIEGSLREILYSIDIKTKIRFSFYMFLIVIMSIIPCFIICFSIYPQSLFYLIWLIIEILIIYTLFHLFSYILHSVLISYGMIFIYITTITEILNNYSIFSLIRLNGFREVGVSYFIFWLVILIISIALSYIIEKRQRR